MDSSLIDYRFCTPAVHAGFVESSSGTLRRRAVVSGFKRASSWLRTWGGGLPEKRRHACSIRPGGVFQRPTGNRMPIRSGEARTALGRIFSAAEKLPVRMVFA